MRILHVIDRLDGGGSACQLGLIAPALAADGTAVEVCCLGADGPGGDALRRAGIAVRALGWTRWLDAAALWELRRRLRGGGHDVIHVWRLAALRVVGVVAPEVLPRVIVSAPLPRRGPLRWWDCRLLRRVGYVAVADDAERDHCRREGLLDIRWQAVPAAAAAAAAGAWANAYPRRIACAGRIERDSGFREAVWAVDVLQHIFPDVHLLIAGDGPYRAGLQEMIDRLAIRHAHLLGGAIDPGAVLAAADVCWVPSRTDRGRHEALAAMALGKPVIAADVPGLRALVRDGVTGLIVPPGQPVALARRTRLLLRDPGLADRLGAAARADVLERHALARVVTRWRGLYNGLAA